MQEILSDTILASLYPNSLVIVERSEKSEKLAPVEIKPIQTEASNQSLKIDETGKTIVQPVITTTSVTTDTEKWFLGENGKKITILVSETDEVFLNNESLQFLLKIIGACKLTMGDIAIINVINRPMTFIEISNQLQSKFCLLFDVSTKKIQLPFSIPNYQVQHYNNCQFLLAPSIKVYYGDGENAKVEKTKLWTSLKKIFNL